MLWENRIKVSNPRDLDSLGEKPVILDRFKFEVVEEDLYLVYWNDTGGAPPNNIQKISLHCPEEVILETLKNSSLPSKFLLDLPTWAIALNLNLWSQMGAKKISITCNISPLDSGDFSGKVLKARLGNKVEPLSVHQGLIRYFDIIENHIYLRTPYPLVYFDKEMNQFLWEVNDDYLIYLNTATSQLQIICRIGDILFTPQNVETIESLERIIEKYNELHASSAWSIQENKKIILDTIAKYPDLFQLVDEIPRNYEVNYTRGDLMEGIEFPRTSNALQDLNYVSNLVFNSNMNHMIIPAINYRLLKFLFPDFIS